MPGMKNFEEKLVLGTVQFGLEYGINNSLGKPSKEESLVMLEYAFKKGIRVFDTAYAYGNAEEILGEFLEAHNFDENIKIITKLQPNIIADSDGEEKVYKIISANLKESLARLKRTYVDGYLLHTPQYLRNDKVMNALSQLKNDGLVKHIGVSIYEEADALYATELNTIDYIQVPYNIFDQRLEKSGFFELAKKNGKKVFARSPFLQGLFFMEEGKIPAHLHKVKEHLVKLDKIIKKYQLSRQKIAMLFSLQNSNIDYVVFGVDTLDQLKENIEITHRNIDARDCIKELKIAFENIEKSIVLPSLWKKRI